MPKNNYPPIDFETQERTLAVLHALVENNRLAALEARVAVAARALENAKSELRKATK